jgi:hypothetical protein
MITSDGQPPVDAPRTYARSFGQRRFRTPPNPTRTTLSRRFDPMLQSCTAQNARQSEGEGSPQVVQDAP